jgi:RNA ligase (TIGR02306 family)
MLASIQRIISVEKHGNADSLSICTVLNYRCITKIDQYKVGDLVVFVEPDSILPVAPWSVFYRSKSNRVKAVKLRGEWSFGVIESTTNVGYTGPVEEGLNITEALGVVKYEAPAPQDLNAAGPYGFGIPRTDETKWNSIRDLPWGELVDVTHKIDGQSWSAFVKLSIEIALDGAGSSLESIATRGLGGRSFLYQLDTVNNYTRNEQRYDVLNKLEAFCRARGVSLCLRGESYGVGIQKSALNPHAKLPVSLALYSTWLIDERRYARKGDPYYIFNIAPQMGLPTVPMLERDVPLTRELIAKYAEGIAEINGQPFEGVVINWVGGSFKVINLSYDSKK